MVKRPTRRRLRKSNRRVRKRTYTLYSPTKVPGAFSQTGGAQPYPMHGGSPLLRPLLDGSDAPPITDQARIDFNVRFQPTVKAREDGPTFTTYQTAHEPYPVWSTPTPPTQYAIICWDPDAQKKSFLHWLVINCTTADNSDGKVICSWHPPSPPPGTGEHRYIIGLFKQGGPIQVPDISDRAGFNPTSFATQHNIQAVAYRGFRVVATAAPPPNSNPNGAAPPNSVQPIPSPNSI